jgi:hypothetical protein
LSAISWLFLLDWFSLNCSVGAEVTSVGYALADGLNNCSHFQTKADQVQALRLVVLLLLDGICNKLLLIDTTGYRFSWNCWSLWAIQSLLILSII